MRVPVRLAGRLMAMPARWEPLLSGSCGYNHSLTERVRGRTEYLSEWRQLYVVVGDDFVCPRGLRFRVEQALQQHGHELVVEEDLEPYRDTSVFEPDVDAIAGVEWRYRQFDSFMLPAIHDDGVIDAVTAYGKTFITGKICQGYPRARILVVVPGVGLSGDMFAELSRLLGKGKVGYYATGSKHRYTRRVTVTTPESMDKVAEKWPDLVLYDEVHTAATEGRGERLMAFNNAKMFGFTGTSDGRSDNAELRVEALFGPKRIDISYELAREHGLVAEITYRQLRIRTGDEAGSYRNDVDKLRYPIWRNEERNRALAKAAIEYATANPGEQVLVAADKTEHALYLQQAFQTLGWSIPVICGVYDESREEQHRRRGALTDCSWVINKPTEVRRYRTAFTQKRELYAIATSTFSTGADFRHLRCLIYASGNSAKIAQKQWAGRAMRLGDQSASAAKSTMIDTYDAFCESAKRRSNNRWRVAKQSGWVVERDSE